MACVCGGMHVACASCVVAYMRGICPDMCDACVAYVCMTCQVGSRSLVLRRPAINQLPLSEVSFSLLFHCLDIDSVIMVLS